MNPPSAGDERVILLAAEFRRIPTWVVVAVPAIAVAGIAFSGSPLAPADLLARIQVALGGGVSTSAIVTVLTLLVILAAARLGRVRAVDVGFPRGWLAPAILATVALWLVAIVLVELLSNLRLGNVPGLHRFWGEMGWRALAGVFAGAVILATMEEVVFRGVLFPQLYLRMTSWRDRPRTRMALALLATQIPFAVLHVPARIHSGMYDGVLILLRDQAVLLFAGFFGVLVLVTTRNLAIAIGIHALHNAPVPLFAPPPDMDRLGSRLSVVLIAFLVVALWAWHVRRRKLREPAGSIPLPAEAGGLRVTAR